MRGEPGCSPPARGGVAPKVTGWWEETCLRTFEPANARRDAARWDGVTDHPRSAVANNRGVRLVLHFYA